MGMKTGKSACNSQQARWSENELQRGDVKDDMGFSRGRQPRECLLREAGLKGAYNVRLDSEQDRARRIFQAEERP